MKRVRSIFSPGKKRHRFRSAGFTLIELLLASALAVVLMGGMFSLIQGILRDRERLLAVHQNGGNDQIHIIDMLRRDLRCANGYRMDNGAVILYTASSVDADTLASSDRPAQITYNLLNAHSVNWLTRQQQYTDEQIPTLAIDSLVAGHLANFKLIPLTNGDGADVQGGLPLPSCIRVEMEFDDSRKNFVQDIVVR